MMKLANQRCRICLFMYLGPEHQWCEDPIGIAPFIIFYFFPFNVFIQTLLTCCIIDLNPNTEWYLTVSQNIYLQSQRRSRDVALKRAFDVAAVDTSKREKKKGI